MAEVIALLYQEICYRGDCYKSVPLYKLRIKIYKYTRLTCVHMHNVYIFVHVHAGDK